MSIGEILWLNIPVLLAGLGRTVQIGALTLLLSVVIGVVAGTAATSPSLALRWSVRLYVEALRGIPLVVNVFFVFYGAPLLGLSLSPYAAVVTGLSLWGGANGAEIVRGGLRSIPSGQRHAGQALGLRRWQVFLLVVAPQALRAVLPAWTGLLALLVQSTSLGALVGVQEFLNVAQLIVERSTVMEGLNPAFAVYGLTLLVYLVICSSISWAARRLERRLRRSGSFVPVEAARRLS